MSKYQYLVENSNHNSDALIIALKPKRSQDIFNFKPGQYVMLSFYDSAKKLLINHPFSIASSPTSNQSLVFGIRIMGKFTQTLSKLTPGSQVDVTGPFGDFVFDENKYPEAIFLAGGVGITPFISASKYVTDQRLNNKLTLLYSNRSVKETLFYEDLKQLAQLNPNFKVQFNITKEAAPEGTPYCENGQITKETISSKVGLVANKDFFLCGPTPFMKAMEKNLLDLGVPKSKIHQEAFNVTPNLSFRNNFKNIFSVYGFSAALFAFLLMFVSGAFSEKQKAEVSDKTVGKNSVDLINNVVNTRRNGIINSKQLLLETIKSAGVKRTVVNSTGNVTNTVSTPKANNPVSQTPVVTPVVSAPVVNTPVVSAPVVNAPVSVPAPTTRVS